MTQITSEMKQKALAEIEKLKALKQQEELYRNAKGTKDVVFKPRTDFVIVGESKYPLATYRDIQNLEKQIIDGAIELNNKDRESLIKAKELAMKEMGLVKQEIQKKKQVAPLSKAEREFDKRFDEAYIKDATKEIDKADDIIDNGSDATKVISEAEKEFDEMFGDTYTKDVSKADDIVDDVAKAADKVDDVSDVAKVVDKADDVVDTVTDVAKAADKVDDVSDATKAIDNADDIIDNADDIIIDNASDATKAIDKADDVVDTVTDVAKVVDKVDDIPGAGKISKAAKVTNFLKKNPKIAKILGNKWAKLGGKAMMPVALAYSALKDFEGFNEGKVDLSGNTFQDIGELAEAGTRSVLDAGGKLALNLGEDAVSMGDMILKGLAWGLGQMGDIGHEATKFFGSDKTREKLKQNEVDYSSMFLKAIDDLKLSDKYNAESNKTKAGLNALLYGDSGFDEDVYNRTLDKYNKKLGNQEETIVDNKIDDSGIEIDYIHPDEKNVSMLHDRDTTPNPLKVEKINDKYGVYQDRMIVKNPDGTFKYLSHQTGDYKDTDEITGEKLTSLDQIKKQIDKGLTQDYAYKIKKAQTKEEIEKQKADAKRRGYTEDDIGISI